jgi:undecaprenyl-diphosphatase
MWVVASSLVAVGVFARVAEDVAARQTAPFDEAVRAWALTHHTETLAWVFGIITVLGSWPMLVVVAGGAAWWLWRRNVGRVAAAVVAAPLGAAGLIVWLKNEFERSRPPGAAALGTLSYSFPSGQTTAMTAVGLSVCYVLLRERLIPPWSLPLTAAAAGLVGASRVYLDAHWATDVIGGWAVGLFVATGCAAWYEWLRRKMSVPEVAQGETD